MTAARAAEVVRLVLAPPADPKLVRLSSVVTPLELTTAYATFAAGGLRVAPFFVTAVEDSGHHLLYQRKPAVEPRVVASHVDRDLTMMLYGVITDGTGRSAALPGREAAGKTGTTQDYRDAWFVGFTPDYVASVWLGNDNNKPMRNITGGTLPAAIWKDVMIDAERGLPPKALDKSPSAPPVLSQPDGTLSPAANVLASGGVYLRRPDRRHKAGGSPEHWLRGTQ